MAMNFQFRCWDLAIMLLSACMVVGFSSGAVGAESIVENGDFETDVNEDGWPDKWPNPDEASWEEEDGNRFMRIEQKEAGETVVFYRGIPLPDDAEWLDVSLRVRTHDVQRGSANWHDARIVMHYIADWGGSKIKPSPGTIRFKQDTEGEWITLEKRIKVSDGARILEFMPSIFQAESGMVDIDDVEITVADSAEAEAEAEREARENPKPKKEPIPEIDDIFAGDQPEMLQVVGKELRGIDSDEHVWLQGVNVASLEWSAGGEGVLESIRVAIDDWNANVIRLPVKEEFWNGEADYQNDDGEEYRKLVDACIYTAAQRGAYTVLDLHRYRAVAPEHVEFWLDAAERYKNHPAVIFGLLNEPHSISWDLWRNGGTVEARKKAEGTAENQQAVVRTESPGMQALLEAVRSTGANNIVSVSGLDWGYDLSGILNGYALDEQPGGHGIMYESHVYPWKSGWQKKFLDVAAEHPILIGEVGAPKERFHFIPESQHEEPETWVPDMLGAIQEYKLNWTAWCFHPKAGPVLLKNWHYEPTEYWGEPAKQALHGKSFELKNKR